MQTTELIDLLRELARYFLHRPDDLQINSDQMGSIEDIQLVPHEEDTGRVIGHRGTRFRAFYRIVHAFGLKHGLRLQLLKVPEPARPGRTLLRQLYLGEVLPHKEIEDLATRLARAVFMDEAAVSAEMTSKGEYWMLAIHVAESERPGAVYAMQDAFFTLFDAIGPSYMTRIRTTIDLNAKTAETNAAD